MTERLTRTLSRKVVPVVLARQRPLEDLPEWAVCCETIRQVYERQQQEGLQLEAVPSIWFLAEVKCAYCGRIVRDVKYVRHISGASIDGIKGVIPIEGFEFDEKPIRYVDSRGLR